MQHFNVPKTTTTTMTMTTKRGKKKKSYYPNLPSESVRFRRWLRLVVAFIKTWRILETVWEILTCLNMVAVVGSGYWYHIAIKQETLKQPHKQSHIQAVTQLALLVYVCNQIENKLMLELFTLQPKKNKRNIVAQELNVWEGLSIKTSKNAGGRTVGATMGETCRVDTRQSGGETAQGE